MLTKLKTQLLRTARATRLNRSLANSRWRQNRLLIVCYHGVSEDDEHVWNPGLFVSRQTLARRLEILKQGGYAVLPLEEAVQRLGHGSLPPRSVVLTFDDGMANFRTLAWPLLRQYGYPATVYLRTDYCFYQRPVFDVVCPYLAWKRRDRTAAANPLLGWDAEQDLRTTEGRAKAVAHVRRTADERQLDEHARDSLLAELANHLGIDFDRFIASRILQIMTPDEVSKTAAEGVDLQLHTHRHRMLTMIRESDDLRKEIEENRARILQLSGRNPTHFCYPSGRFRETHFPALRQLGIVSATTCEPGMAQRDMDPLALPRFVDTELQSDDSFEAWLSGVRTVLSTIRRNKQTYSH